VAFVIAVFCIVAVGWMCGLNGFFLAVLLSMFPLFFGAGYVGGSFQAGAITGIEELSEPNWYSNVYMAWLFTRDRKRWQSTTLHFHTFLDALLVPFLV
jgi:hypothetical protein